jgi:hypothetical protein
MGVKGILLCAAFVVTGYAQRDPMQLLIQIRHRVADRMSRIPRYLCTETVDRTTLGPDSFYSNGHATSCASLLSPAPKHKTKMQLISADRLRLDVAIIDNTETYSWVGEGRFQDQALSEMVRMGATSTGSFGSFLQAIFLSDSASFAYQGEAEWKGRHALEYSFTVPLWRSSYVVANQTVSRRTAFSGSLTADAETLDLLRVVIQADALAPELQMCALITTLDYAPIRMNDLDFLLPTESSTQLINVNGHESHNRTAFSSCHQFLGESKLIFDDPATTAKVSGAPKQVIEIPAGLTLSIALAQAIDPATEAAGDMVKGVLKQPVNVPASGLAIAKGTLLNGRICQLLVMYGEEPTVEFGIKWESLELDGAIRPLELSLQSAVPGTAKAESVHAGSQPRGSTSQSGERGIGYFLFSGVRKNYRIPAGFESEWVTLPALPISK